MPSSGHAALPACIPMPGWVAPLCQSLQGMGAERLLQKSSATEGIMVCLGNRGLMELSAPPSPQHQASAAA